MKLGLQLYSVRDKMAEDFCGTLTKVAQLGIKGVEFAGFFNHSAEEVKMCLEKNNLVAVSTHLPSRTIMDENGKISVDKLNEALDFHEKIGCKDIIIPAFGISDDEGKRKCISFMQELYPLVVGRGFRLGFHNHRDEFTIYNGKYFFNELMDAVPGLKMQLDVYWAYVMNVSPLDYFNDNKDKCFSIHLKDGLGTKENQTALGDGNVDIEGIVKTAKELKFEYGIIECEEADVDSLEVVKQSVDYLNSLKIFD